MLPTQGAGELAFEFWKGVPPQYRRLRLSLSAAATTCRHAMASLLDATGICSAFARVAAFITSHSIMQPFPNCWDGF